MIITSLQMHAKSTKLHPSLRNSELYKTWPSLSHTISSPILLSTNNLLTLLNNLLDNLLNNLILTLISLLDKSLDRIKR